MITDRGKVLLAAAAALWLASRALGVDAFGMAAAACLALVGLAFVYTRASSARLRTRRLVRPARLFHDARGRIDLEVRNEGRVRTATLIVEDHVPAVLAEAPAIQSGPVRAGETVRLSYDVRGARRGRYRIGPARILLRDPFGLAQRAVEHGRTDELVVYPPILVLPPALPRSGRHGTATEGRNRPPAPRGELATVREYVRGDDLRKVHWKTTAHRGRLMVTQDEAPRDAQATIVLDTRRGAHDSATFEAAVTAAASAAYHLDHRGYTLQLVSGPLVTGSLVRARGTLGWRSVLDELAAVEPSPLRGDLGALWSQLRTGLAGDGLLLAVVALPSPADLRAMTTAGRGFGARAAVVVDTSRHLRSREARTAVDVLRASGWRVALHAPEGRLDVDWEALGTRPVARAGVAL